MTTQNEDDGGFDICAVSMSTREDRGPLQMISGERLSRLQTIESTAVRYAFNPTLDNLDRLVALIRQK